MLDVWDFISCPITDNLANAYAWFETYYPLAPRHQFALAA